MKLKLLLLLIFYTTIGFCQIADYRLKAENFQQSNDSNNQIIFDVNLLHQHNGSNFDFHFVGGQFVFTINQNFPMDLLVTVLNPIGGNEEEVYFENNRLIITCHIVDNLIVSDSLLGSKLMSIQLNSNSNLTYIFNSLRWVNVEDLQPRTQIYQYDQMHNEVIDISTSFNHFVLYNLLLVSNNSIRNNVKHLTNYPNPFNAETKFNFSLNKNGFTRIIIYNSLGQKVESLINQYKSVGLHSINFNFFNLNSGTYYYLLELDNNIIETNKFIIIK